MGYKVGARMQAASKLLSPLFRAGELLYAAANPCTSSFKWQNLSDSKAKQGYCIYRVRVKRGDRKKRVAKA